MARSCSRKWRSAGSPARNVRGHLVPGFIDYLFLAFNTSTAFSPRTARPHPLAKVLMMIQSFISLATVALIAARAVNIL